MNTQQRPAAFKEQPSQSEFFLRRAFWIVLCGSFLFFVASGMKLKQKLILKEWSTKSSFRYFCMCGIVFLVLAAFLIIATRKSEGDRAQVMIDTWPVTAYSMMAVAIMLFIASFHFWTDILGPMGILYWVAFWGFGINVVMAIPV
jgi:hypothetical protein